MAEASFSGLNHLPETRVKMSEAKTGVNNPMSGKSHSPESKALISGANHHMYGKSHSNETRVKISDALTGPNNPMYGKVPTHAITVNVNSIDNVLVRSFPFFSIFTQHSSSLSFYFLPEGPPRVLIFLDNLTPAIQG